MQPVPSGAVRPAGMRGAVGPRRPVPVAPPAAGRPPAGIEVYSLKFSKLLAFFLKQPASFWFISAYIFFEYVRPQQIYTWLPEIPYNKISLILAGVSMLVEGKKIRWGIVENLLVALTAVVVISSMLAVYPAVSFDHLSDFTNWVLIYFLLSNIVDSESRFVVFMLFFMVWNFKMSLHGTKSWAQDGFAFRDWGTGGAPGFFQNSGEFGIEMCVFIAVLIPWILVLRKYWARWKLWAWLFIGTTAITGLVGSSSRGAIFGVAAVALARLAKAKYKWRALIGIIVVGAFVFALMPPEARARYTTMGQDETSVQRKNFWKEGYGMMQAYPAFGIGYKNWMSYHTVRFPDEQHLLPHNIFIEVGAELGYAGIICFLGLIGATLTINRRTRKLLKDRPEGEFMSSMAQGLDGAMFGYLLAGMFVTVFYYPFFWINLAMTAALHNAAVASVSSAAPSRAVGPARRTRVA